MKKLRNVSREIEKQEMRNLKKKILKIKIKSK